MNFRKFFLIITSLSVSLFCNAETISFPVKGLVTVSKEPVYVNAQWDEKWFGEKSAYFYNHNLARIAGILSCVAYEEAENDPNNLIVQCLKNIDVKNSLIEQHYKIDYNNSVWGNNQTGFTLACKEIDSSMGKRNLILVIIRGTPLSANEWFSNINISDRTKKQEDFHEGFFKATKQIETALISFLLRNKIDIDDSFLFITGHSRGGAIANLLSAQLFESHLFNPQNIYSYTFAAPNVTTLDESQNPLYNYIWNIVNAEDIVPTVPFSMNNWKYKKYGNTKALINDWNTEPVLYEEKYLCAMNVYFSKLMERNYSPFKTGPFLPVETSSVLSVRYPYVSDFYGGLTSIHTLATTAFKIIFPENKGKTKENAEPQEKSKKSSGVIVGFATRKIHKEFGMDTDSLINTFVDMHAMETYLSWILALDESDVFSSLGTNLVLIDGPGNYAVFDENGKTLASIVDGSVEFSRIKLPVAANSLMQNQVAIGLPENRNFKIVLSHESIIPTPLKVTVQNFTVDGYLNKTTKTYKIHASIAHAYSFDSNKDELEIQQPEFVKEKYKKSKKYRKEADIQKQSAFKVLYEVSANTSGTINSGVQIGSSNFYGSLLAGHNVLKLFNSMEISPGFGTQAILYGKILLNIEAYSNFIYLFTDRVSQEDRFNIVPSTRFLLSYKPKSRFQIFTGLNLDTHISGFNDAAFEDAYRVKLAGEVWTGSKIRFVPSLTIGMKF